MSRQATFLEGALVIGAFGLTALGFVLAVDQPTSKSTEKWETYFEFGGDVYIVDYDLTYDDCIVRLRELRAGPQMVYCRIAKYPTK